MSKPDSYIHNLTSAVPVSFNLEPLNAIVVHSQSHCHMHNSLLNVSCLHATPMPIIEAWAGRAAGAERGPSARSVSLVWVINCPH